MKKIKRTWEALEKSRAVRVNLKTSASESFSTISLENETWKRNVTTGYSLPSLLLPFFPRKRRNHPPSRSMTGRFTQRYRDFPAGERRLLESISDGDFDA